VVTLISSWTGRKAASWGRKPLLLIAFGVLPIRGVLYTLTHNTNALVAIQVLDGVAAGIFGVVSVLVIADLTSLPDVSPDGKSIACAYYRYDRANQPAVIGIYPFAGGAATKYFNRPAGAEDSVYWNADGAAIDYVVSADGVGNVWRQPLDGSPPGPITAFRAGRILFSTVSPDKKMLMLGRGQESNDLVLLSDIR
jgi:hypothetical protein